MPSPSVVLNGTFADITNAANIGSAVVELVNFGANVPRISGTGILVQTQITVQANGSGVFTVTLWRNDLITPSGTYYVVRYLNSTGGEVATVPYPAFTADGTFDLSTLSPLTSLTTPVPPNAVLTNPTGLQIITGFPLQVTQLLVGTNPATIGTIAMLNGGSIAFRNATNTGDLQAIHNVSNTLVLGFNTEITTNGGTVITGTGGTPLSVNISGSPGYLFGGTAPRISVRSDAPVGWSSTTVAGTNDTGLSRIAAGIIAVGNGTNGDFTGAIKVGNGAFHTDSIRIGADNNGFWASAAGATVAIEANGTDTALFTAAGVNLGNGKIYGWASSTGATGNSADTGLTRTAAGVVAVGNGTAGNLSGTLNATNVGLQPLGVATSLANFNSGNLNIGGSYWNGTVATAGTTVAATTFGTGTNPTVNFTITLPTTGSALTTTLNSHLTIPTNSNLTGGNLILGGTPATAGTIRMPNTGNILLRNAANTADLTALAGTASNTLNIGYNGEINTNGGVTFSSVSASRFNFMGGGTSVMSGRSDGTIGFAASTSPGTNDTAISRGGAVATLAVGNGTAGDASGTLQCATVSVSNGIPRTTLSATGKNWQFLGTATGATTTVGPVVWTGTFTQFMIMYLIKGYNGGTPVGRLLFGPAAPSTTALTNGSNLSEGVTAPTSAPSIPGCPLAVTLSNIGRAGTCFVRGASGDLKSYEIYGQLGSPSVSSPPQLFRAAGAFSDLSTNLPLQQAQLTVYDTLTAVAASAQTFVAGTTIWVWGRNSD